MRSSNCFCLFVVLLAFSLGAASTAVADTKIYDWPDEKRPVLVENDSGLIFLTKDKEPDRVYEWSNKNAGDDFDPVYLVDLGEEDGYEIVGAGSPMFVLQTNGDPLWSLDGGCKQTILGRFLGDSGSLEILCNEGRELKLYTNDGQLVWSIELGRSIEHCNAGDYNGDLKTDLECKYRGRDDWARIDAEGEILSQSVDTTEISEGGIDLQRAEPVSSDIMEGKQHFDLDGDGHSDERIQADQQALVIQSKARDKAIARVDLDGEPEAAFVKDLDGDGSQEIIAATSKSVYVIGPDGEQTDRFSADAGDYERVPHAKLNSVYANGFTDDEEAKKIVENLQDDLSQCYSKRVRTDKFTNTGRMILQVQVDDSGSVNGVSRTHSDIKSNQIQQCAKKALSGGEYPNAEEGGAATVNVNMKYTFRDE